MGSPILVCVLLGPGPRLLGKAAQFHVAMPVQFQRKVSLLSLRQLRSFRKTHHGLSVTGNRLFIFACS